MKPPTRQDEGRKPELRLLLLIVALLASLLFLVVLIIEPGQPITLDIPRHQPLVSQSFQGTIRLEIWIKGEMSDLLDYSNSITKRLATSFPNELEGADNIQGPNGMVCLFRWLIDSQGGDTDFPVSRDSFGSQLPGRTFQIEVLKRYQDPILFSEVRYHLGIWLRTASKLGILEESFAYEQIDEEMGLETRVLVVRCNQEVPRPKPPSEPDENITPGDIREGILILAANIYICKTLTHVRVSCF